MKEIRNDAQDPRLVFLRTNATPCFRHLCPKVEKQPILLEFLHEMKVEPQLQFSQRVQDVRTIQSTVT